MKSTVNDLNSEPGNALPNVTILGLAQVIT